MLFASDAPWEGRFYAWADDPLEAEIALWAIGVDPETTRVREFTRWTAHLVTPAQLADLVALGATVTDRFGPLRWLTARAARA